MYKPALITVACPQAVFMIVCLGLREHFRRLNKKLETGEVVHVSGGKGETRVSLCAVKVLHDPGDRARYGPVSSWGVTEAGDGPSDSMISSSSG